MKKIKQFEQFLNRFWTLEKRFNEKVFFKTLLVTSLRSFLMTMIWLSIPLLVFLNLSIWIEFRDYLMVVGLILFYVAINTYSHYFLKWITKVQPNLEPLNLKWLFQIERRLVMILLTSVLIAVFIGNWL